MAVTQTSASVSVAALVALTPAARGALGARREIQITRFPFKVGRESRNASPAAAPAMDQRRGLAPQLNDVYLLEPVTELLQISREHFSIEREGDQFFVVDRGSVCGTIVGDKKIGGNRAGGRAELRPGDTIVVGTSQSAYAFRFELTPHEQA